MFFRSLRKSSPPAPDVSAWWREAAEAELNPSPERIGALRTRLVSARDWPDEAERQEEMLDGLDRLIEVADRPNLPVIATQHRVIGHAVCHFVAPAGLAGPVDAPGKLFVTSQGIVFAAGRVQAWPWHRLRSVARAERALLVSIGGTGEPAQLLCNSYGDAMMARYLATRLRRP